MLGSEEQEFSEEVVRIGAKSRSYWLPTVWLASVVLVGVGGILIGGAKSPPKFLADVREALSNTFGWEKNDLAEVIRVADFEPSTDSVSGPDRILTGDNASTSEAGVSNRPSPLQCIYPLDEQPARDRVLISEVAWMGGLESEGLSARSEWVELENTSPLVVNIGGWYLADEDGQIGVTIPVGVSIAPGEFYLLERTDDTAVPGVTAGVIYSGSLANEDDGLKLFNDTCHLEDEVLADPGWPAGEAATRRTMEWGSNLVWHTFSRELNNGVLGTPREKNSSGVLSQEELTVEEIKSGESFIPCSVTDAGAPNHSVLINEVAWSGRSDNTSEEWIELYYSGKDELSLAGWQLFDAAREITIQFSEADGIDGYMLLRRILSDDDPMGAYYVVDQKADKTYTGVLQNSGESLYLFDAQCILVDEIDEVGANWESVGGTASPEYRTAERTNRDSWHTYSGSSKDGVRGTPRASNSRAGSYSNPSNSSNNGGSDSNSSNQVPTEASEEWCSQDDLSSPTHTVYLNEIAWAGSVSSTSAEWIELYTPVEGGLSLNGWQLQDKGGEIKISFGKGERINDYLLLRRILAEDNPSATYTIAGVTADKVYTGILQNEDETLRLFDASCNLVDEVIDVGADWINIGGSASPEYRTAERVDEGWQTYLGGGGGEIMGTPRAENSIEVEPPPDDGEENPPDDSGDEEEDPPDEEEPPVNEVDLTKLSIVEVIFDLEGADDGLERVELSNSGEEDISIETFSLQYLRIGGDFAAIRKKNFESGNIVPAQGSFVVGMSCSTATPCEGVDMSWSQALANDGGDIYLVANQEAIVDNGDLDIIFNYHYGEV